MNKLFTAFFFIIFFTSCFKDGLNEDVSGILAPETFYQSERNIEIGLIPMYKSMANAFSIGQNQLTMMGGDDISAMPGSNKADFRNWEQFDYNASNGWMIAFCYKPYWRAILVANTLIEELNEPNEELSQEYINGVLGQARFIRGLSYLMLVRQFGNVPLLTTPFPSGKEDRSTVLDNYRLIEEDFKFAENNLPDDRWPGAFGKPTSGAAKTALATLYLTWGGWPVKDVSKYKLAADKAKEVIQSGKYELVPNYIDFWKTENDDNKEDIFSAIYSLEAENTYHFFSINNAPLDVNGWQDIQPELTLFYKFPKGPRFDATYQTKFMIDGVEKDWTETVTKHPAYLKWTISGEFGGSGDYDISGKNVPIFRYAELLLTFAEAEAMSEGGPTLEAYDAINLVRQRAGLDDLVPNLDVEAFRDSVVMERAYELAGEFTRWFDLVRTEKVEEATADRHPWEISLINQPSKEFYISPLPEDEIKSNPNLIQNPEGFRIQ